jgi:hypothetical protein
MSDRYTVDGVKAPAKRRKVKKRKYIDADSNYIYVNIYIFKNLIF